MKAFYHQIAACIIQIWNAISFEDLFYQSLDKLTYILQISPALKYKVLLTRCKSWIFFSQFSWSNIYIHSPNYFPIVEKLYLAILILQYHNKVFYFHTSTHFWIFFFQYFILLYSCTWIFWTWKMLVLDKSWNYLVAWNNRMGVWSKSGCFQCKSIRDTPHDLIGPIGAKRNDKKLYYNSWPMSLMHCESSLLLCFQWSQIYQSSFSILLVNLVCFYASHGAKSTKVLSPSCFKYQPTLLYMLIIAVHKVHTHNYINGII